MKAITLETWEEVNEYFEQGWFYVDCKIIEKKGKVTFYFILEKNRQLQRIIINRSRQ